MLYRRFSYLQCQLLNPAYPQEPVGFDGQYALKFTMSIWPAIKKNGKVASYASSCNFSAAQVLISSGLAGASMWINGGGVPAQIPKWNDKRVVVLLGKPPFEKKFEPVRYFQLMAAKVKVLNPFSATISSIHPPGQQSALRRQLQAYC